MRARVESMFRANLATGSLVSTARAGSREVLRGKLITRPPNNAFEPARSTPTAWGPRGSMRCWTDLRGSRT